MQRPHYVFRNRPHHNQIDYWTGHGWNPKHAKAKPVEWAAGLELITVYRSDPAMADYGFGMSPAAAS